jgi:hypothetical protein
MSTNSTQEYDHLGGMYLWLEIELKVVEVDVSDLMPHHRTIKTDEVYRLLVDKIGHKLQWKLLSSMEYRGRSFPPAAAKLNEKPINSLLRRFVTIWKMPAVNPGQGFFKGDQMLGTWAEYGLIYPYITDQREEVFQPALFNPRRVWAHGETAQGGTTGEDPSLSYEETFPFEQDLIVECGPSNLAYLPSYLYGGTDVTKEAPNEVKYLVHQGVTTARIPAEKLPREQGPAHLINLASLKMRTGRS